MSNKIAVSRRNFLKTVACASAGAVTQGALPGPLGYGVAFANSCFQNNKTLVLVYLDGGLASHELLPAVGSGPEAAAYLQNNFMTGIRTSNLYDANDATQIQWRAFRRNRYMSTAHVALPISGNANIGLHWSLGNSLQNPDHNTGYVPRAALASLASGQRSIQSMMNTPVTGGWNCAIVNKVGYPQPNYSHEDSHAIIATGYRQNFAGANGWLGRLADTYCTVGGQPRELSFFSFMGRSPEVKASSIDPFILDNLSNFGISTDSGLGDAGADSQLRQRIFNTMQAEAPKSNVSQQLMDRTWQAVRSGSSSLRQAATTYFARTVGAVSGNRASYPTNNSLATRLQQIAALVREGVNPGICCTSIGGFDMHSNSLIGSDTTFWRVNSAISAFEQDLRLGGVANQVTLVVYSEFGRNGPENLNNEDVNGQTLEARGHDHGHGTIAMVFDAAARAGVLGSGYEERDFHWRQNFATARGDLFAATDIREVLGQVIGNFGINPADIFPDSNRLPNSGLQLF